MSWILRRVAPVCAAALVGLAAAPAHAQADAGIPTASAAPTEDATETAAPRRRPVPRSEARPTVRTRPTPRGAQADTITVPVRPASTRSAATRAAEAAGAVALWSARVERTLRDDAPNWLGIPYRWGGTTRRGIDCSAFVQQYVRENLAVELPRTTASQRYEGVAVDRCKRPAIFKQ